MILLTGASGFIGKHLLKLLIEKFGEENILALTTNPSVGFPHLLHNNYKFDRDFFVKNGYGNIKTIIHAGAFTPKNKNQVNLIYSSNSNIFSTQKLLNTTLPQLQNIIFLSTIDVYDNVEKISEDTLEKPASLYGFSKLYCEKMIESWGNEHNKVIQILRVGHVYGPGEEAYEKIIPVSLAKIINNESIQIFGSGNELRSFIFIKDAVNAIINSIELKANMGVINLVSSQAISINDIINKIKYISKADTKIENIQSDSIGKNFVFDNSKMLKILLEKETNLDKGLKAEYEYMKALIIDR